MISVLGLLAIANVSKSQPYEGTLIYYSGKGLVAWQDGRLHTDLKEPGAVVEWSPKLDRLLACVEPGQVVKWVPGTTASSVIVDCRKLAKIPDSIEFGDANLSLSPDLKTLAVYTDTSAKYHLTLIDVATKKVTKVLSDADIVRSGAPTPGGIQRRFGLAWTPDSQAIAVAVPGKYPGGDEPDIPTESVMVTMKGKVSHLGRGYPIAWLDSQRLLCALDYPNLEYIRPEILLRKRSKPIYGKHRGTCVAFDGQHVVLDRGNTVEVLDSHLKLQGQFKLKASEDLIPDLWQLIAVPPGKLKLPRS